MWLGIANSSCISLGERRDTRPVYHQPGLACEIRLGLLRYGVSGGLSPKWEGGLRIDDWVHDCWFAGDATRNRRFIMCLQILRFAGYAMESLEHIGTTDYVGFI